MSKNRLVLIKEKYNLVPDKTEDDIIYLKGPVAVFGEKNNNNRVYEEANYLPLLEELHAKIKANNLTGELDHPGERLEVYLTKASHKIEELLYDKNTRTVTAKIRLIKGTGPGDAAIALHKNGVSLGISSRAIGTIKENVASLKKIITFDLVSTPGFKSAMLGQVNEGVDYTSNADECGIYDITDKAVLEKFQYLLEDDYIPKFKIGDIVANNNHKTIGIVRMADDKYGEVKTDADGNVDVDTLELYDQNKHKKYYMAPSTKKEISKLDEVDKNNKNNHMSIEKITKLEESLKQIQDQYLALSKKFESFNNYNDEHIDELNQFVSSVKENQNDFDSFKESFSNHNANETEKLNKLAEEVSVIDESMNDFVGKYTEYNVSESEKLNSLVNYINENAEKMQSVVEYMDKNSEKMNAFVNHQDGETNKLNSMVAFLDNYSEKMNNMVSYLDETADNMESFVDHQDAETTKLNKLVEWNEKHFGELYENKTISNRKNKEDKLENIKESVDNILNKARKQKALQDEVFTQYPFLENISESKQQEFLTLDNTRKTMVSNAIKENASEREDDIIAIWEQVNEDINDKSLVWLTNAPEKFKQTWAVMNETKKEQIIRTANMRNFNTISDIEKFWTGLNINEELILIRENTNEFELKDELAKARIVSKNNKLGYTSDYINQVKEQIKRNR